MKPPLESKIEAPKGDDLPPLHNAVLQLAQVEQLFADIENCTEIREIIPKYAPQAMVPEGSNLSLAEARELLASGRIRALQVRYLYEGAEWWDTLMAADGSFRAVRIRHDFSGVP